MRLKVFTLRLDPATGRFDDRETKLVCAAVAAPWECASLLAPWNCRAVLPAWRSKLRQTKAAASYRTPKVAFGDNMA